MIELFTIEKLRVIQMFKNRRIGHRPTFRMRIEVINDGNVWINRFQVRRQSKVHMRIRGSKRKAWIDQAIAGLYRSDAIIWSALYVLTKDVGLVGTTIQKSSDIQLLLSPTHGTPIVPQAKYRMMFVTAQ